jgi:hypothetical protein
MDDTKREWVRSWLTKAHSEAVYDFVRQQFPKVAHSGTNHTAAAS